MSGQPQHLSPAGAAFIAGFEGCVLHPYNDPLGFATIGVGHLLGRRPVNEKDRRKWGTITRAQAFAMLQRDAESFAASVRHHVTAKLSQPQFDALVSFCFNVGPGQFEKSTLLRLLNCHPGTARGVRGTRALREVEEQLGRWVNKGTPAEAGLVARRRAEGRLFTTGRYR